MLVLIYGQSSDLSMMAKGDLSVSPGRGDLSQGRPQVEGTPSRGANVTTGTQSHVLWLLDSPGSRLLGFPQYMPEFRVQTRASRGGGASMGHEAAPTKSTDKTQTWERSRFVAVDDRIGHRAHRMLGWYS